MNGVAALKIIFMGTAASSGGENPGLRDAGVAIDREKNPVNLHLVEEWNSVKRLANELESYCSDTGQVWHFPLNQKPLSIQDYKKRYSVKVNPSSTGNETVYPLGALGACSYTTADQVKECVQDLKFPKCNWTGKEELESCQAKLDMCTDLARIKGILTSAEQVQKGGDDKKSEERGGGLSNVVVGVGLGVATVGMIILGLVCKTNSDSRHSETNRSNKDGNPVVNPLTALTPVQGPSMTSENL